jgi:hypothetical protein
MRHTRGLRTLLAGSTLLAITSPVALACFVYTAGAGAAGTQTGAECVGGCANYIDCPESDTCPAKFLFAGAETCTPITVLAKCAIYKPGAPIPGSACCQKGVFSGWSALTTTITIYDADGVCLIGQESGDPQ